MRILVAAKQRSDIATKWRKVIAMGESPWNIENSMRSPEGTKGTRAFASPFRPFGAPLLFVLPNPWARAQWLHRFVPSGLGDFTRSLVGRPPDRTSVANGRCSASQESRRRSVVQLMLAIEQDRMKLTVRVSLDSNFCFEQRFDIGLVDRFKGRRGSAQYSSSCVRSVTRHMMRLSIGLYMVIDDTKGVRPICGPNCIGYWDFPDHVINTWLGHSSRIAERHYLQTYKPPMDTGKRLLN